MNSDNLETLCAWALANVPRERFDFRRVFANWGGAPDLSCGTTACIIGWGMTCPALRDQGLAVDSRDFMYDGELDVFAAGAKLMACASCVFGLTGGQNSYLFDPSDGISKLRARATLEEVVDHIRRFINTDGQSFVDDQEHTNDENHEADDGDE